MLILACQTVNNHVYENFHLLLQPSSLLRKIILAIKRVCCIPNASNKAKFSLIRTKIPF